MTRRAGGLLSIILLLLFPGNKTGRERRAELKKVVHTINNNKILNFVSLAPCPDNPCIEDIILVYPESGLHNSRRKWVEGWWNSILKRVTQLIIRFHTGIILSRGRGNGKLIINFTLAMHFLFRSCLCKVCSHVSETLTLAIRVLFCSCLCKVCSQVSEALTLAIRVLFCSCLCNVC